jgi:multicomponent Na+:H+ antiporter subunit C
LSWEKTDVEALLAILVGGLFAAGAYLLMRRSIVKLILGLALLSHAVHLLIFTVGGLRRGAPPLVPADALQLGTESADPLPQALILTAIVISFGVIAFTLALVYRTCETVGTDDLDEMRTTDT